MGRRVLGFLFCVVLPIPIYANDEPFIGPFDASELTILVTRRLAYVTVWYCGRRLDAFSCTGCQHRARRARRRHHLRADSRRVWLFAGLDIRASSVLKRHPHSAVDGGGCRTPGGDTWSATTP